MDFYKRYFTALIIIIVAVIFCLSLFSKKIEIFYPHGFDRRSDDTAIGSHSTLDSKLTQIAFLKIGKTGSTTMVSIIVRFCLRNNLTVYESNITGVSNTMQKALLAEGRHYNCFTRHTFYDYNFFTNIVKNPVIIGLLRHPEERLISHAFYFLRKDKRFDGLSNEEFLDEIISNTVKYHCHNVISKRLQISDKAKLDKELLNLELAKVKSEFMLVLILERFDESLVLMKRLMHWSFIDIVYTRKNEYKKPKSFLNNTQKEKVRESEDLDFEVYNYFLNELEKKIRDAGEDFYEEVFHFRQVLRQWNMFCQHENKANAYQIPKSKWESSINVYKKDCGSLSRYVLFPDWHQFNENETHNNRQPSDDRFSDKDRIGMGTLNEWMAKYRSWDAYVRQFGDIDDSHWLGLEKIHRLTKEGSQIYFDIENYDGKKDYVHYQVFTVHEAAIAYKMNVDAYNYKGSLPELLSYHNKIKFSTYDRDNDVSSHDCCEGLNGGGWWYNDCYKKGNLNGVYGERQRGGLGY